MKIKWMINGKRMHDKGFKWTENGLKIMDER